MNARRALAGVAIAGAAMTALVVAQADGADTEPHCAHYGTWDQVPDRLVGKHINGVGVVTDRHCWHVGDTTTVIGPHGGVARS